MIYKDIYYPCKQENFLITIRMKKVLIISTLQHNTITSAVLLVNLEGNFYRL